MSKKIIPVAKRCSLTTGMGGVIGSLQIPFSVFDPITELVPAIDDWAKDKGDDEQNDHFPEADV